MHEDEGESHDPCQWAGLRRRLRDLIAWQRAGRLEVAAALGIPLSTLVRVLVRDGERPSQEVVERAQAFLDSRHEKPAPDTTVSASGGNDARPPSGNGAASTPHRLSEAERDRLLGYLELTPKRQVRTELRMSTELAQEAATGAEIPPEAIQSIHAFFEADSG